MLNQTGIITTSGENSKQILFNTELFASVGVVVDDLNVAAGDDGKKIMHAGTPLYGNIADRDGATKFTFATTPSANVNAAYALKITTAFAADEVIIIGGVSYTQKASENVGSKQFTGATPAEQVTSLLKMVALTGYVITGATDTLTFTVGGIYKDASPVVTKTATTGAFTLTKSVAEVVAGISNAVGVLMHDVDVTLGDANGTMIIFGFIDLNKLASATAALITDAVKTALKGKVTFLK